MTKFQKIALIVCALCISVLAIIVFKNSSGKIGAANTSNFSDLAADSATFGTLTTTGTSTFSGAIVGATSSLSTLTVTGTSTLNTLIASSTDLGNGAAVTITGATSTLKIGDNTSGTSAGCLVLGDSGGATSSPVYISATGATITATTTKPAICR